MLRSVLLAILLMSPVSLASAKDTLVLREGGITRVDRSGSVLLRAGRTREASVVSMLAQRSGEFGWIGVDRGLSLASQPRALSARAAGIGQLVEIVGSVEGVPLSRPVAHVLVDESDGRVRLIVNEGAIGPLVDAPLETVPTAARALAILAASGEPGSRGATQAKLVAVPGETHTRFAWRIDAPMDWQHLTNPIFLVDAKNGQIGIEYDELRHAKVTAFEFNPVRSPTAAEFDLIHVDAGGALEGPYFRSVNCINPGGNGCTSSSTAMADAMGNFIYPVPDVNNPDDNIQPDDVYSEISMYYHADKFLEHMLEFGFVGLPCNTGGGVATLVANYKRYSGTDWTPYDNAFYSGSCSGTMTFGQGTQVDFSYDGDVVYHELGHGVVSGQRTSGLGGSRRLPEALAVDAGGLNEAIADFVSSSYAGDPIVADYIGEYWDRLEATKAIRDNSNDYVCPHDLVGEVHLDGEPFAALMWFAFEEYGNQVIPAVLDTTTALASNAVLGEAAAIFAEMVGMHVSAEAQAFVDEMANARGLVDCIRVTQPDRLRREMFVQGNRSYAPHAPPPLQLTADAPADATMATVTFEAVARANSFGDDPGDIDVGLLVKTGAPMTFEYTQSGNAYSVSEDSEQKLEHIVDQVSFPVVGGSTVYMGFVALNATETKVQNIVVTFDGSGDTGDESGTSESETSTSSSDSDGTASDTGSSSTSTSETGDTSGSGSGSSTEDSGGGTSSGGTTTAGTSSDSGVSASSAADDEDGGDDESGESGGANEDDPGCGCTTTPQPGPSAVWLLALVALRRRRRTSPA